IFTQPFTPGQSYTFTFQNATYTVHGGAYTLDYFATTQFANILLTDSSSATASPVTLVVLTNEAGCALSGAALSITSSNSSFSTITGQTLANGVFAMPSTQSLNPGDTYS